MNQNDLVTEVGDYLLTKDRRYSLWKVERLDGGVVPVGLEGRFPSVDEFRTALAKTEVKPEVPGAKLSTMGGYSNNTDTYVSQLEEARGRVRHLIGDYVLTLDKKWFLFEASRADGKPVPVGLRGKWKTPGDFKRALEVQNLRNAPATVRVQANAS